MLGVFAVWALSGFGYPSAPVPITLNVVSKILAFVTVLTLFLPQRPPRPHDVQPESLAEAQPAGRPMPDAPAHIDIADDQPVTAGHPAAEAR
jgi:hypothetical protein